MKISLFFIITLFCIHYVQAQEYEVHGNVYAFKDVALKNIIVTAKKSGAVVKTDSLGQFTIKTQEKDRLTFTGHGFQTIKKSITGSDTLHIKMVFIISKKNEEVALGYGHISKESLTYAVAYQSNYNNDFGNYPDMLSLLVGKFPGVEVRNNEINIRRSTSLYGSTEPLYIVDDVIVDCITNINPVTVKSIDILKDSSASIYGSRGANGVIIIKTVED